MTANPAPKRRTDQADLLHWIGRLGAVTAPALAEHDGCSEASARGRLQAAVGVGLLARARPLRDGPSLFTATRAGMARAGYAGAEPTRVSAASARHQIVCAEVAVALERRYPRHIVSGERELQRDERELGGRLASARMSWRSRWGDSHRPDLVVWPVVGGGAPVAVEVELTPKAPARLLEICHAWARCRHVAGVLYVASPAAFAPVARAIAAAGADGRIALLALEALEAPGPASPVTGTP